MNFFDFAEDAAAIAATLTQRGSAAARRNRRVARRHGGDGRGRGGRKEGSAAALFGAIVLVDVTPRFDRGREKILGFMRDRAPRRICLDRGGGRCGCENICRTGRGRNPRKGSERIYGCTRTAAGAGIGIRGFSRAAARPCASPRARSCAIEAAKRLRIPALLVRGASSELVREEHAREFLALAPHAQFVDVAGARHMVAGDRNDAFSDAIIEFLAKLPAEGEKASS